MQFFQKIIDLAFIGCLDTTQQNDLRLRLKDKHYTSHSLTSIIYFAGRKLSTSILPTT